MWVVKISAATTKLLSSFIVNCGVDLLVLLGHVWMYAGKRVGFGRESMENKFKRRRERRDVS